MDEHLASIDDLSDEQVELRLAAAECALKRQRLRTLEARLAADEQSMSPADDLNMVRLSIDKFDGAMDTFIPWTKKAAIFLRSKGLVEITGVERDGSPSKGPLRTPLSKSEIRKDDVAKSLIMLNMVTDQVSSTAGLANLDTAAQCWQALHKAFNPSTKSTIGRALSIFVSATMLQGECAQAYVSRIRDAAERLRAVAPTEILSFNDELTALLLIRGLRSEFATAFVPIHARSSDSPLTTDEVLSVALQEEMRIQDEEARVSVTSANAAIAVTTAEGHELQALRAEIAILRKLSTTTDDNPCCVPRHVGHTNKQCYQQHPELRQLHQVRRIANTTHTSHYTATALSAQAAIVPDAGIAYLDSGCSQHMLPDRSSFVEYMSRNGPDVSLGDNSRIKTTGAGSTALQTNKGNRIVLNNTLHVPTLGKGLLSVGQLTGAPEDYKLLFDGDSVTIFAAQGFSAPNGTILGAIQKGADNMYKVGISTPTVTDSAMAPPLHSSRGTTPVQSFFAHRGSSASRHIWHERLGHLNERDLCRAPRHVEGMIMTPGPRPSGRCEPCILGKMQRAPFPIRASRTSRVGQLIHTDIKGPLSTTSKGGHRYFVTYLDDFSDYAFVYFLGRKSEQFVAFKDFQAMLHTQHGATISAVQSDNGGEYVSAEFQSYLRTNGILHRTTVPGDSEQNGKAERINRTLMECAESMRLAPGLPPSTWSWSVSAAARLRNIRPCSNQPDRRTPYESFMGNKPDISYLRIYGSDCWAHVPDKPHRRSLAQRARRAVFVGYETGKAAYKLFDVESAKVFFSRDVIFNEGEFTFYPRPAVTEPVKPITDDLIISLPSEAPVVQPAVADNNRFAVLGEYDQPDADDDSVLVDDPHDADDDDEPPPVQQDVPPAAAVPDSLSRSDRRRQPPSEWWKAPQAANRASTTWAPAVDKWIAHQQAPSKSPPQNVRRAHRQRLAKERVATETRTANISISPASLSTIGGAAITASLARIISPPSDPSSLPRPDLHGIKAIDIPVPKNMGQALASPYAGYWWDAAMIQMGTLEGAGTFGPVTPLPKGKTATGSTWVFKVKPNLSSDGSVRKFSARLCAQGFAQKAGFDYDKTFAPTACPTSMLTVLALAAQHGLHTRQIDFVAAYLNGVMEHEVYMRQAAGFVDQADPGGVRRLVKAIYGTKQGAERWHDAIVNLLIRDIGFTRTTADPCVFILHADKRVMIIGLHTDDCLIAHNDKAWADTIIQRLHATFPLDDQGAPSRLLGMRVRREGATGAISIDQEEYVDEILAKFNMADSNPVATPHQPGLYFSKTMSPATDIERAAMADVPYLGLLGSLQWLAHRCRPDIAAAVNVLSEYAANPGRAHWTGLKRILAYLKGTRSLGIKFELQPNPDMVTWADADWAGDPDTRRSRTGTIVTLAGGAIYWLSRRQDLGATKVALSSTHAEIKSLCAAARITAWLRLLLTELGFPPTGPTRVLEDNRGAKAWSGYRRMDQRTKDIEVQFHYSREAVEAGIMQVDSCATADMAADYLTKPSSGVVFKANLLAIGVTDTSASFRDDIGSRGRVATYASVVARSGAVPAKVRHIT